MACTADQDRCLARFPAAALGGAAAIGMVQQFIRNVLGCGVGHLAQLAVALHLALLRPPKNLRRQLHHPSCCVSLSYAHIGSTTSPRLTIQYLPSPISVTLQIAYAQASLGT